MTILTSPDERGGYNQESMHHALQVHYRSMFFIFLSTRQLAKSISWIRLDLFYSHQCLLFPFNNNTVYLNSGVYLDANQSDCYNKQLSPAELNKISRTAFFGSSDYIHTWCLLYLVYSHLAGPDQFTEISIQVNYDAVGWVNVSKARGQHRSTQSKLFLLHNCGFT